MKIKYPKGNFVAHSQAASERWANFNVWHNFLLQSKKQKNISFFFFLLVIPFIFALTK